MVQDEEGRWWAKHRDTGKWNVFDGITWVEGTPPGYQTATTESPTDKSSKRTSSPSHLRATEHAENRRKALPWVLGVGLVVVIAVIVVVTYLGGNLGGTQKTVEVPQVVGTSRDQAEKELRSAGFEVAVKAREGSADDAGKVIEQSPSGGEAKKNSVVAITVGEKRSEQAKEPEKKAEFPQNSGPAPGYNLIQTPDGSLSAEVPPSWGVETGENSEKEAGPNTWSYYAGEYLTSSITTAPDLDAWYSTEGSSGAYFVAARVLAQYSDYEITHSLFNASKAETCAEVGPYDDYDRPPYLGKLQTWYGCGDDGATVYTLAAYPEGRECVVALNARVSGGAEREAIEHLVNSFEVDCGEIATVRVGNQSIGEVAYATSY
jgi:beta-lactam-binding protein with PASTA domain